MKSNRPHISHYNVSVKFTDRKTANDCAHLLEICTGKKSLITPIWVSKK
jgi:hypothetical protein